MTRNPEIQASRRLRDQFQQDGPPLLGSLECEHSGGTARPGVALFLGYVYNDLEVASMPSSEGAPSKYKDGALQEIKDLRDEIRQRQGARQLILAFTVASVGALAGIALAERPHSNAASEAVFAASVLALVVIGAGAQLVRHHTQQIATLSAYIRVYLEPLVDGVAWETRWTEDRLHRSGLQGGASRSYAVYFGALAVISILGASLAPQTTVATLIVIGVGVLDAAVILDLWTRRTAGWRPQLRRLANAVAWVGGGAAQREQADNRPSAFRATGRGVGYEFRGSQDRKEANHGCFRREQVTDGLAVACVALEPGYLLAGITAPAATGEDPWEIAWAVLRGPAVPIMRTHEGDDAVTRWYVKVRPIEAHAPHPLKAVQDAKRSRVSR